MHNILSITTGIIFSVFESRWRRWFGGGFIGGSTKENKWYNLRAFQHVINIIAIILTMVFIQDLNKLQFFNHILPDFIAHSLKFIIPIYTAIIIEGLFWSRAHGPAFDISRGGMPDEKTIQRYKKEWWNKICEFIVPPQFWYQFGYDYLWIKWRYTACLFLLTPVFGWNILLLGLTVPAIYATCWSTYENYPDLFKSKYAKLLQSEGPTELAEYLTGLLTGIFIAFS